MTTKLKPFESCLTTFLQTKTLLFVSTNLLKKESDETNQMLQAECLTFIRFFNACVVFVSYVKLQFSSSRSQVVSPNVVCNRNTNQIDEAQSMLLAEFYKSRAGAEGFKSFFQFLCSWFGHWALVQFVYQVRVATPLVQQPMDLRQVPSLSTQQLVAFALAILCELAKCLGIPFTVSADIGDPELADEGGRSPGDPTVASAASLPEASSSTPAPTIPAPATPPGPRQGCCFLCPVRGCNNLCCKTSPHQQHVCSYHSWC